MERLFELHTPTVLEFKPASSQRSHDSKEPSKKWSVQTMKWLFELHTPTVLEFYHIFAANYKNGHFGAKPQSP
ncbi:MAG: hypothetical protein PHY61_02070 [Candidatus Cloacimonetes bacterium]|nr:hypothetical protein [Candidatus Cloacimonadota bacterium]